MSRTTGNRSQGRWGALAPLRYRTFRTIWLTSILSNFGQLILGVGAAWEMTRLTDSVAMVALVQTALMLPLMLVAVPAGALADMYDRRKVAMSGLSFSILSSLTLTTLALAGLTTPWMLLGFCTLIGVGVALYTPAWQSSISEQVTPDDMPAAIALGSISYNVARSFGPALGGMIVMAAGSIAAFSLNAVLYVPLLIALFFWRREHVPSRLPPERIGRAIISGARYAMHSAPVRTVLLRTFLFGMGMSVLLALTPLAARDLLGGDARTYGLLLGGLGVGAIAGALGVSHVRARYKPEVAVRICTIGVGLAIIPIAFSRSLALTCGFMAIAGALYILLLSLFNVVVQLSSPRWVTARALSWYQSATTGGIAIGALLWGQVASHAGVATAFAIAGAAVVLQPLLGLFLRMPRKFHSEVDMIGVTTEPEVSLPLTVRSGPIIVEFDYRVAAESARKFYEIMLKMQRVRLRNGGFGWSLARDLGDPELWTERYHCPTWGDYLQQRSRFTLADSRLVEKVRAFNLNDGTTVRRRLERPFGSVRYRADTPDPQRGEVPVFTP